MKTCLPGTVMQARHWRRIGAANNALLSDAVNRARERCRYVTERITTLDFGGRLSA